METTTAKRLHEGTGSGAPTLGDLAAGAKSTRNRAVDFYRAAAMLAVATGHWLAVAIGIGPDGELSAGNALQYEPDMAWLTWLFQVMPLFFVVGGFSSAMSLDSHNAQGGRPQDWVVARLRRMVAPTIVLATTWLALFGLGLVVDTGLGTTIGPLVAAGAVGAAIPLWFLANYTIDTALAPYVLPVFRRSPVLVAGAGLGVFASLEALRFVEVEGPAAWLPNLNWVLGWLLFQMAGFAWRDGLLPSGRALVAVAAGLWTAAIAAVTVGPYPVAMVDFAGVEWSPTNPPSIALLLFGAAYSATAVAAAPAVTRFLAANRRAWASVVAANSVSMSVYLWHMTAAAAAGAVFYALGWLPTAEVGTGAWWLQKMPMLAASALILVGLVAIVSRAERTALLAPRSPWNGDQWSMLLAAGVLSTGIKLWSSHDVTHLVIGMAVVTVLWFGKLRDVRPGRSSLIG